MFLATQSPPWQVRDLRGTLLPTDPSTTRVTRAIIKGMPDPRLVRDALPTLRGPGVRVTDVNTQAASQPGLYALYGSGGAWRQLGLGTPPDGRPLYVGKAETTLASRDLQGHFGMRPRRAQSPTGSSTVRRSLAALLASSRGYRGMPRNPANPGHFPNFGLSCNDDEDLSTWMKRELRLAMWPHPNPGVLDGIETEVLKTLLPPLNIDKVVTPWQAQVKNARKLLAQQAREWAAGDPHG